MDNRINELLNKQINKEIYSAYLYWAMSAYFSETSMEGFAKYMKKQAKEELEHAQKIFDYLILRDEKITFARVEEPDTNWVNAPDAISSALEHEISVSESIKEIYRAADEVKDYATMNFLNWFVEEQLEEEEKFRTLKDKIKAFDDCSCTIEAMDREMENENEA